MARINLNTHSYEDSTRVGLWSFAIIQLLVTQMAFINITRVLSSTGDAPQGHAASHHRTEATPGGGYCCAHPIHGFSHIPKGLSRNTTP